MIDLPESRNEVVASVTHESAIQQVDSYISVIGEGFSHPGKREVSDASF
jgi:hypothetical protein